MTNRFSAFGDTDLGRELVAKIDTPDRYVEFKAFSREGFPAVTALVSVLTPILMPLKTANPRLYDAAKQFVGAHVATILRRNGHSITQKSKAVPGKLFSVGAVWSDEPSLAGADTEISRAA